MSMPFLSSHHPISESTRILRSTNEQRVSCNSSSAEVSHLSCSACILTWSNSHCCPHWWLIHYTRIRWKVYSLFQCWTKRWFYTSECESFAIEIKFPPQIGAIALVSKALSNFPLAGVCVPLFPLHSHRARHYSPVQSSMHCLYYCHMVSSTVQFNPLLSWALIIVVHTCTSLMSTLFSYFLIRDYVY